MAPISSAQDGEKPSPTTPPAAGASAENDGYLEDTPNEALKVNLPKIKQMIQSAKFATPAEKQMIDDYFENYEFKVWTQKKNSSKTSILSLRNQLRTYCKQAKAGPVHDRLNELVLEVLGKKIKNRKYRPVFLVNAMLAIGELNAVEGSTPTPLPQALPVLLEALDDAQQLDAVKISALDSIRRHVVSGVKDPTIAKVAFKLASVEDSEVAKAWMRDQAVEILGYLQSPGAGNEVVKLLQKIIADKKATEKSRLIAAEALGQINLSNAAGLQANNLIAALTQLMKDGCDAELKNVKNNNETVSRRKTKAYLGAVVAGLGDASKNIGVASLKDPAAPPKIAELLKILNKELLPKLDNEDTSDEDLEKAVAEAQKKLG